jgi:hypothetical protein
VCSRGSAAREASAGAAKREGDRGHGNCSLLEADAGDCSSEIQIACFDLRFMKHVDTIFKRVFGRWAYLTKKGAAETRRPIFFPKPPLTECRAAFAFASAFPLAAAPHAVVPGPGPRAVLPVAALAAGPGPAVDAAAPVDAAGAGSALAAAGAASAAVA